MNMIPMEVPNYSPADFSQETWWLTVLKAVFIIVFLILNVLLALWVERRTIGRMQTRPGPNVAGPFGLFQAIADAVKLLFKEDMWTRKSEKFIYLLDKLVVNLLQVCLCVLFEVFRQSVLDSLLQFILNIRTGVAHFHLCAFSNLVALLHKVAATLFCWLGKIEAYDLSVVLRSNANTTIHDSFLNVLNGFFVPRTNGNSTCIGCRNVGYLV